MTKIKVNGMSCEHCKNAVETAVKSLPGVRNAKVDLSSKELVYEDANPDKPVSLNIVLESIRDLGFEPVADK